MPIFTAPIHEHGDPSRPNYPHPLAAGAAEQAELTHDHRRILNRWINDNSPSEGLRRLVLTEILRHTVKGGKYSRYRPTHSTIYRGTDSAGLRVGIKSFSSDPQTARGFGEHVFEAELHSRDMAFDMSKLGRGFWAEDEIIVNVTPRLAGSATELLDL